MGVSIYPSNGTFNVPPNLQAVEIEMWGGGGGGGTASATVGAGGGGSGGYVLGTYAIPSGTT
jgi:MSHA biogenesis protein MshQ